MDTGREDRRKPVPAISQQKNRLQGIPLVGTQMSLWLGMPGAAGNLTVGNLATTSNLSIIPRATGNLTIIPRPTAGNRTIGARPDG
jgi:hypothetical protein